MRFHLEIELSNDAFVGAEGSMMDDAELSRLLREVADEVNGPIEANKPFPGDASGEGEAYRLRDRNGNTVGRYWWTDT